MKTKTRPNPNREIGQVVHTIFRASICALLLSAIVPAASHAQVINYGAGFTAIGLQYNGNAALNGTKAELTTNVANEAGSVFTTTKAGLTAFTTTFTFQMTPGTGTGEGITFTAENSAITALGANGTDLGYTGIANSVALKFDMNLNGTDPSNSSIGVFLNGAAPTGGITTLPNVILQSGDIMQADLSYASGTLNVKLTDTVTSQVFNTSFAVNYAATIGNSQAYFGFTGGNSAKRSTNDIRTWTLAAVPEPGVNALLASMLFPAGLLIRRRLKK